MKVVAIDQKALFETSRSRHHGGVPTITESGISFSLPTYKETGEIELTIDSLIEHNFSWEEILSLAEDNGYILISAKHTSSPEYQIEQIINQTYTSKEYVGQFKQNDLRLAIIHTPSKISPLDDIAVFWFDCGQIDLSELNIDSTVSVGEIVKSEVPVEINCPTEVLLGNPAYIEIVQKTPGTTIYVESTAGILNRSRLSTSGTVKLDTSDLASGETIKIKTGYKYWSGINEAYIKII